MENLRTANRKAFVQSLVQDQRDKVNLNYELRQSPIIRSSFVKKNFEKRLSSFTEEEKVQWLMWRYPGAYFESGLAWMEVNNGNFNEMYGSSFLEDQDNGNLPTKELFG